MSYQKICVLGLGYIGLPTASTFATQGLTVIGVDINPQVVNILRSGGLHIHEPGLRTLVQAALVSGNLTISEQPQPADAFILAVPTPFFEDKKADMSFVVSAAEAILPVLKPGNLVMLELTSPPRTTVDLLAPILERSGMKAGADFHLAYTPERVLPGQILRELIENARVIGGVDRASAEAGRELYSIFVRGEIFLTDATTAEMVKLMENTYRDVNIAIANEFARLAERFGIDAWEAIRLANLHPRVKILQPGPGVGGHCIGVDPWFLVEAAPDITPVIHAARQVNDGQPAYVAALIQRAVNDNELSGRGGGSSAGSNQPSLSGKGPLAGKRIALLGLAYKPDVDDLRESPAIEIARRLAELGAVVRAFEPYKPDAQIPGVQMLPSLEAVLQDADVVALLVAHAPLVSLTPAQLAVLTPARRIVDAVNAFDPKTWNAAGFSLYRLGVGVHPS